MRTNHLIIAVLASLLCWGTANASLLSRAGGQAYYDTDLNVTWLADANLAATNTFGVGGINPVNGQMTWDVAENWITAVNSATYLGVNSWRLPVTSQPDPTCSNQNVFIPPQGSGTGCTGSEMGHLFNATGIRSSTPSPFSHVQNATYWSGTLYAPDPIGRVWSFDFFANNGTQDAILRDQSHFANAWAVSPGDVLVPVPGAAWLLGSALGLLGLRRKAA
jgi:hypothetical protein